MKRFVKVSLLFALVAMVFSSCNCYNRMVRKVDMVEVACSPEVVTLRGHNAVAEVTVTFPAKYFDEMAVWKITPVLVYEGGEIAGTPKYVQGEDVQDNYSVISWANGGSYTQTVSIPYADEASISTLELRIESKCSNACTEKNNEFVPVAAVAVASGVRTTSKLADNADYMTYMKDNFKRVITYTEEADILYAINRYNVRPVELTSEQIKLFEDFVKENSNKDRTTLGNVYAKGYASPDGPLKFNDELSKKRSETGKEAATKVLSDVDVDYDVAAYGEDWEGFKELVQASDMEDKDLILQVLDMYSSPVERDQQIQNMTAVWKELTDDIFPQLRRTKLVASADVSGKTDAELIAAAKGNLSALDLEEAMYAATLVEDRATEAKVYKYAAEKYNDARAYNNYAIAVANMGDWDAAEEALEKAASMSNDPAIANNMAAVAIEKGDFAQARTYLAAAEGVDVSGNQSLLAMAEGNPTTDNLSGYDLAVAQLCLDNPAAAKAAISDVTGCADSDYIRAVASMREGDSASALSYLDSAIELNPEKKEQAENDIEFVKLFGTQEFLAL
ncbi:MAG: hypothetical protein R3Y15_04380 [Rikenellaceae bacterium]